MTAITLLTQADCVLCEHAKGVLAQVATDYPLEVTEIDLASPQGQSLAAEAGGVGQVRRRLPHYT